MYTDNGPKKITRVSWTSLFLIGLVSALPTLLFVHLLAKEPSHSNVPKPVQYALSHRNKSQLLAITHVTVINPLFGSKEEPDQTILINESKIVFIGKSSNARIPPEATVHDARGKYIMPGLWDAHVHLTQAGARSFPLFIANGVTSVRDMGSVLTDIRQWQAQRAAGAAIPRIISPGLKLVGMSYEDSLHAPYISDRLIVTSPAAARAAVDRMRKEGVDFIKVHEGMTPTIYQAVVDESRAVGLPFAGHIPVAGPIAAAEAGQRTIEHGVGNGTGMLMCSAETWLYIRNNQAAKGDARLCAPLETQARIFPALVKAKVWFTPTLVSGRGHLVGTPELKTWRGTLSGSRNVYPALEAHWKDPIFANGLPTAFERKLIKAFAPLTAAAAKSGVHILAGTDLGDPYVIPGYALHDELELMVKGGVPTLKALQSATSEPALAFGLASVLGSVAVGKTADLVVLNANPLLTITNTRRIHAVILNGRWIAHPKP